MIAIRPLKKKYKIIFLYMTLIVMTVEPIIVDHINIANDKRQQPIS